MSNTSATGGYLSQTETALPGGLSITQYLQKVIVGLTGLSGEMVRPKWQKNPPKMPPTPEINWCAFKVTEENPDANAFTEVASDGEGSTLQRHVELRLSCSFYGSLCMENASKLRDGFQIAQNRDALKEAKIGFKETSSSTFVPELFAQVWYDRCDITVILRRQVDKTFAVLSFEGASGTLHGLKDNNETENVPWNVSEQQE